MLSRYIAVVGKPSDYHDIILCAVLIAYDQHPKLMGRPFEVCGALQCSMVEQVSQQLTAQLAYALIETDEVCPRKFPKALSQWRVVYVHVPVLT